MKIQHLYPISTRIAIAVDHQGGYWLTDGHRFVPCESFPAALNDDDMKRRLFYGEPIDVHHVGA